MTNKITKLFGTVALGLSVAGGLLVCEVIRPFHDFSIDGPMALSFWGIGATLGLVCFFLKGRSLAFSIISLVSNVVPLLGALVVWWVMSQSNFAWR
jgi:hypothetical protein